MDRAAGTRPRTRSRGWIVFFLILVTLAVVAIVLPIVYNLGQQLRAEDLATARQHWSAHGPTDYDLTFTVQYDREPKPERHVVVVRGGKVVFASAEGQLTNLMPAARAVVGLPLAGTADGARLDVPALFARLEVLLQEQIASGGRNFLVASFDRELGYPRRFVRRVRGTSTREEWKLRVWPPGEVERSVREQTSPRG